MEEGERERERDRGGTGWWRPAEEGAGMGRRAGRAAAAESRTRICKPAAVLSGGAVLRRLLLLCFSRRCAAAAV